MIKTLKSNADLQASRVELGRRNLDFTDPRRTALYRLLFRLRFRKPLQPTDLIKSWDVDNALKIISERVTDLTTHVLDMGCYNSEVVYGLHALGFTNVHGCDLNPLCRWMPYWNKIRYAQADLTKTPYPDNHFGAITCLSVIEHGVPLEGMAKELQRVLKPGGIFIFTTDYDATGQTHEIAPEFRVFGQSWKIFTPETLGQFTDLLQAHGFQFLDPRLDDSIHTHCPIEWNGQRYTFILVAMEKV